MILPLFNLRNRPTIGELFTILYKISKRRAKIGFFGKEKVLAPHFLHFLFKISYAIISSAEIFSQFRLVFKIN